MSVIHSLDFQVFLCRTGSVALSHWECVQAPAPLPPALLPSQTKGPRMSVSVCVCALVQVRECGTVRVCILNLLVAWFTPVE